MAKWTGLWRVSALMGAAVLTAALPAPAQPPAPFRAAYYAGRQVAANEALVRLRASLGPAERTAAERSLSTAVNADLSTPIGNGATLRLRSRDRDTAALIRDLSKRSDVTFVEPNHLIHLSRAPNDPYFWSLWGLQNTGQTVNQRRGVAGADIHAAQAWDITTGSDFNIVGVVDTGIDYNHPDLAANVWRAPRSFPVTIGGVTTTCPEGGHGYNALANNFDPMDDNNHGTHCAGTIGAVGDDGYGIPGVNWTASLMGLKFIDAAGHGTAADAINAIEFAIQARLALQQSGTVRVLSNSWSVSGPSEALREQIARADLNEMLFVAASGNSGEDLDLLPSYPQSYLTHNMINVAATGMADVLWGFSTTGASTVHLAAPGYNVISTIRNGGYASFDGTSMAAPHVAGAAALMLAVDRGLSVDQLKSGLLGGADPQPSLAGKTVSGGRLNAYAAVAGLGPRLDFRIDLLSPPLTQVVQGDPARFDVLCSTSQSYGGDVTLTLEGLPAGATAAPQVIGGGGLVSLFVETTAATPPGTYSLVLRGTGGELVHTLTPTLEVLAAPEFTISASPEQRTVKRGGIAHFQVRVRSRTDFRHPIALSISELPPGWNVKLGRSRVLGNGRTPLALWVNPGAAPGAFPITIRGESNGISHSGAVVVTVRK